MTSPAVPPFESDISRPSFPKLHSLPQRSRDLLSLSKSVTLPFFNQTTFTYPLGTHSFSISPTSTLSRPKTSSNKTTLPTTNPKCSPSTISQSLPLLAPPSLHQLSRSAAGADGADGATALMLPRAQCGTCKFSRNPGPIQLDFCDSVVSQITAQVRLGLSSGPVLQEILPLVHVFSCHSSICLTITDTFEQRNCYRHYDRHRTHIHIYSSREHT